MEKEYLLNGKVFTLARIESMAEEQGVSPLDIIEAYGFEPKSGGINIDYKYFEPIGTGTGDGTKTDLEIEDAAPNILNQRLTVKPIQHISLDSDGKANVDELYFSKIVEKRDNGDGVITVEELPGASKATGKGELRFSHNDEDNAFIIKKIKTGKYGYDIKSKQLIKLDTIAKGFTEKSTDELVNMIIETTLGVEVTTDEKGDRDFELGMGEELYTSEEDDGMIKMKKILSEIPGLEIDTTTLFHDRIKIKSKKSGKEIVLEFDLDGLKDEDQIGFIGNKEGAEKLAKENTTKLRNFLAGEIKAGNIDSWDIWRQIQHVGSDAIDYYESVQEAEMGPIRKAAKEKYLEDENLFNPFKTETTTAAYTSEALGDVPEKTYSITTFPHKDKLENTTKNLVEKKYSQKDLESIFVNYGGKLNEDEEITINEVAQQIVRKNLYTDALNEGQSKWMDIMIAESGKIYNKDRVELVGKLYYGNISKQLEKHKNFHGEITKLDINFNEIQKSNEVLTIFGNAIDGANQPFSPAIGDENKLFFTEEQLEIFKKYGNNNGLFFSDYGDKVEFQLPDGRIIETTAGIATIAMIAGEDIYTRQELQKEYSENASNAASEIIDDEIAGEAFALNYQLGEKYMTNITLGGFDIVVGIGQVSSKIIEHGTLPGLLVKGIDKYILDDDDPFTEDFQIWDFVDGLFSQYNQASQRERAQYTRDVEFSGEYGAFTSPGRFARFMLQETSTQLPILAAIMLSGGYGGLVIGASSGGGKYMDMQSEIAQGTEDYSEIEMLLTSLGYGGLEGVISHYTTVPILQRAKQRWVANGKDKLLEGGSRAFFNDKTPGLVSEILLETGGESVTTAGQNMVEILSGKNIALLDNIDHSAFSGATMTMIFAGIPFLKGAYQSRMSDRSSLKKTRELYNRKLELHRKINDKRSTNKTRNQFLQELQKVDSDLQAEYKKQKDQINNKMGAGASVGIQTITESQMELQNMANDIINDSEMSKKDKTEHINFLRAEFNRLDAIKTNTLSDKAKDRYRSAFISLKGTDPDNYNRIINLAKDKLIADKDGAIPTEDQIEALGQDIFNAEKIRENNAKIKKGAKNKYNFQSFETVAEAADYINNKLDLTKAAKAALKKEGKEATPENIQEIVDSMKSQLIQGLEKGDVDVFGFGKTHGSDGVAIRDADGNAIVTIAVVENQIVNERSEIKTHEIGHQAFWDIFSGTDHDAAFKDISKQILHTLKGADKKIYNELLKDHRIWNNDGTLDPKEVISVFLEYVARKDVGFVSTEKKKGLSLLFGSLIQKGFDADYNFDFRGENDMYNFVVGLGQKIAGGDLTLKDITEAKQSGVVIDLVNDMVTSPDAPTKVYNKAASRSTNMQGMLDNYMQAEKGRSSGTRYVASSEEIRDKLPKFLNEKLNKDANGNRVADMLDSELMQEMMPYIKAQSGYIWGGVDPMNREGITRSDWERDVATELYTMIQQEYLKPDKNGVIREQDLDKFVRNRGYYRVFTLANGTFNQLSARLDPSSQQIRGMTADTDIEGDFDRKKENRERKKKKDLVNTLEFKDSDGKIVPLPTKITTEIENNILKTFKTKLGKFKNAIGTFAFRTELAKEYQQNVSLLFRNVMQRGDKFNTDPKKDKVSNKQKRINVDNFVDSTFDVMWDRMDIGTLNARYPFLTARATNADGSPAFMSTKEVDAHNDAIDKGLSQGKKIANREAPNKKWEKIPQDEAKIKFKEYMKAEGEAANVYGARVLSYADLMASIASFELQTDVLKKNGYNQEAFINDLDMQFGTRDIAWSGVDKLSPNKKKTFYDRIGELVSNIARIGVWGDRDNMKEYFIAQITKVYGDIFKNTEIRSIALDLVEHAKKFDLARSEVVKEIATFRKYLIDKIANLETDETVRRLFKLDKSVKDGFGELDRIKKQRSLPGRYIRTRRTANTKRRAIIDLFTLGRGMFASAAKIGDGSFKIVDGVVVKRSDAELKKMARGGEKFNSRSQSFRNNIDLFETIKSDYEGEIEYTVDTSIDGKVKLTSLIIDGEKVTDAELNLESEKTTSVIDPKGNVKKDVKYTKRKAQSKRAQRFIKTMMKVAMKDKSFDNMDKAMTVISLKSGMESPIKRAANLEYVAFQKGLKAGEYRWEHMMPTNYVVVNLIDYYMNNNNTEADKMADKLFKKYHIAVVPKTMDKVFDETRLKQYMPVDYTLDQPSWRRYYNFLTFGDPRIKAITSLDPKGEKIEIGHVYEAVGNTRFKRKDGTRYIPKKLFKELKKLENADKALNQARATMAWSKSNKGISVLDFDDTVVTSKSKVIVYAPAFMPGTSKEVSMELTPAEFAERHAELERMGASFDFSQFNKVVDGKKGPLFNKLKKAVDKFGNDNVFILTARPQSSANAIHAFLEGLGIKLKIENITGLENGTPQAKADWITGKVAEGYNDFYFADDALPNVKAVKNVLDNFDVKSKVQQARIAWSKGFSAEINDMIGRQKGIKPEARYSLVQARMQGKRKDRFKIFNWYIPPSAEDFRGLTSYTFAGKGKQGDADQKFIEDTLVIPYTRGVAALETARQTMKTDYTKLTQLMGKPFRKKLGKRIPGTPFTYEHAIRVALFTRSGYDMTQYGMSKRDIAKLNKIVNSDSELSGFADGVQAITKRSKYMQPSEFWDAGSIMQDFRDLSDKVLRKEYLSEFNENVDIMFNEDNLLKIQALYGTTHSEALRDAIVRMKTGRNRTFGQNRIVNGWMNWVNDAIGTIMFFNRRSALLQTISSFNFINWSFNNPIKAATAFANQPQYWKDFVFIWNSDKLKQRRGGLRGDVQEAELAEAARRGGPQGVISYLLKIGFMPTQLADNFAISAGGATFYRNRINDLKKQVNSETKKKYTQAEAETQAWAEFSLKSDENQQSADPLLISQEQASVLGRIILAFQNTPMQYSRLIKKAGQDLINRRGDPKTHITKILYYGAIQNFMFSALQQALFALIPGFGDFSDPDDDEEESEERELARQARKQEKIINSMIDTLLRGSGLKGAVLATVKNTIRTYYYQKSLGYNADHAYTIIEAINLSPPIGSKARKIYGAIQTEKYDRDVIKEMGFEISLNNKLNVSPSYNIIGQLTSAIFNIPLDRALTELRGVQEAFDVRNTKWQRIALALGWRTWDVGAGNEDFDLIKIAGKERRKLEGIEKAKKTRAENKRKEKAKKQREQDLILQRMAERKKEEKLKVE